MNHETSTTWRLHAVQFSSYELNVNNLDRFLFVILDIYFPASDLLPQLRSQL